MEESHHYQAQVLLSTDLFQEYHFLEPSAGVQQPQPQQKTETRAFRINLSLLMECLNIFNGSTSTSFSMGRGTSSAVSTAATGSGNVGLQISYAGPGAKLELILEDGPVKCEAGVTTMDYEEIPRIQFGPNIASPLAIDGSTAATGPAPTANIDDETPNEVIISSELLLDALGELDWTGSVNGTGSGVCTIKLSNDGFELKSDGTQVEYSTKDDAAVVFERFRVHRTSTSKYKISSLQQAYKALALATKVQLRVDTQGTLNLQLLVQTEDSNKSFVDFLIAAHVEPQDEDEDDYSANNAALQPVIN